MCKTQGGKHMSVKRVFVEKKPAFAAFIYDNPDYPGHMHGFHTPEYYENLKVHDAYVGEIIAEIFALDTPQVWTSKSMSQVFE